MTVEALNGQTYNMVSINMHVLSDVSIQLGTFYHRRSTTKLQMVHFTQRYQKKGASLCVCSIKNVHQKKGSRFVPPGSEPNLLSMKAQLP